MSRARAAAERALRRRPAPHGTKLCVGDQAVGEWEFKLSENSHDSSLKCGHDVPDRVMTMVESENGFENPGFEVESTTRVVLTDPTKATAQDGATGAYAAATWAVPHAVGAP